MGRIRAGWVAVVVALVPMAAAAKSHRPREIDAAARERIVQLAEDRVGEPFKGDCTGFVLSVFQQAGIDLQEPEAETGSEAMFLAMRPHSTPRPGDVAFFHDTHDRNHDGLLNDPWTHVGIVERVRGSRLTLIHRGHAGIARLRIDLRDPHSPRTNSGLRFRRKNDPPGTQYLAGELLKGFAAVPANAVASGPGALTAAR